MMIDKNAPKRKKFDALEKDCPRGVDSFLKKIISSDKSLHSSILVVNLKKLEFRKIKFTKKKGCLCN